MSQPAQRRPVAPEDLFKLTFLQSVDLAPDGRTVVYTRSHVDAADHETCALWLLALETGECRQLTTGAARDGDPAWSPDGRLIAFTSDRSGRSQIYLIAPDGGEARVLTDLPRGVGGGLRWSPDGRMIAFGAGPQDPAADPALPYRVTRHTYRFDGMGDVDRAVQTIYTVDRESGEVRPLTDDARHNTAPRWSPDGRSILYLSNLAPDTHQSSPATIRIVDRDTGVVRDLLGDWGLALCADWTPDGKVAFLGRPQSRSHGSRHDLWVIDPAGGAPACRSTGLPADVGGGLQGDMPEGLTWSPVLLIAPDGEAAYVTAQDGGAVHVYRVVLAGAERTERVLGGERSCFPLGLHAGRLLFAATTLNAPTDLYLAGPDDAERRLTDLNGELLAQLELPRVEHLRFTSPDGTPVEGWALVPPGAGPHPMVLYIHGGPHSGFGQIFSFDAQLLAGAGFAVLLINQRGSTGYGDAFATAILGDWGNLDYQDLMAGVDAAIAAGIADPARLGVCGLSGGGYLTCWIVGQTGRFKAAVPENPVTNWHSFYGVSDIGPRFARAELGGAPHEIPEVYTRCSPISYAHRCTTPTLLIQGEIDYRCPAEQSEQFYTALKASGCVVEMLRLPGGSHVGSITGPIAVRRAQNQALLDWMWRYVV